MKNTIPLAVGLLALASVTASAATLTFAAPGVISGDADVYNAGTPDLALYFNQNGGVATQIVNGVTFTNYTGTTGVTAANGYTAMFAAAAGGGPVTSYPLYGSGTAPFGSLSTSYQAILGGAIYSQVNGNPAASTMTLTLGGLTPGTRYQFELFVDDSRNTNLGSRNEVLVAGNTSASFAFGNNNGTLSGDGATGSFILGSFTADAATQAISVVPGNSLNGETASQINAFELATVVPEPSTNCFLGLSALASVLCLRHRSRQSVA